jgi:hypothetical protein
MVTVSNSKVVIESHVCMVPSYFLSHLLSFYYTSGSQLEIIFPSVPRENEQFLETLLVATTV